jgi:hypothetical protein
MPLPYLHCGVATNTYGEAASDDTISVFDTAVPRFLLYASQCRGDEAFRCGVVVAEDSVGPL